MEPDASTSPSALAPDTPLEQVAEVFAEALEKKKEEKREKKKKKLEKEGQLGTNRGIETMFRTSYQVNMELSSLADTKANIMITINGLILPILLGAISPKIDSNPWLLVPTSVLMIGCLISMTYAIRSARPRVSEDPVTLDQVRADKANILFFGHFTNMSREDFETGMTELMQNTDRLYHNMIRDIYSLGGVLALKFRLLRTAYTVFMVAIVLGVLLFIGVYMLVATERLGVEPEVPAQTVQPVPQSLLTP